jgi:ribonuclease HI
MIDTPIVHIWTDGACIGNPGPGGWGFLKTLDNQTVQRSGRVCAQTTNNQMELAAAIQGLRSLKRSNLPSIVYSDSKYLVDGMNRWLSAWKARGWLTSEKRPVANRAMWEALDALTSARLPGAEITFVWVKGHAGVPQNEAADQLAEAAARLAARSVGVSPLIPARFDIDSGLVVPIFDLEGV